MRAIADTHLHLYPDYNINKALSNFAVHLPDTNTSGIACLAERHDCAYFEAMRQNAVPLEDFEMVAQSAEHIELKSRAEDKTLHLLPGGQIITAENIEILALACPARIADGLPAQEVVAQINQLGGVAVVPWSPGKWFFKRGKVVAQLFERFTPQQLMVGDTTLRPYGWLMPRLIRKAKKMGFVLTAGSDPLPFSGEEKWFGVFQSTLEGNAQTADELFKGLLSGETRCLRNKGKRSWPWALFFRLKANAKSKSSS